MLCANGGLGKATAKKKKNSHPCQALLGADAFRIPDPRVSAASKPSLFSRCIVSCAAGHPLSSLQYHSATSASSPASIPAKATARKTWSRRCGMSLPALARSEQDPHVPNTGHLDFRSKHHSTSDHHGGQLKEKSLSCEDAFPPSDFPQLSS